jgi:hypothetical protein
VRGGLALTAGLVIAAAAGVSALVLQSHGGGRPPASHGPPAGSQPAPATSTASTTATPSATSSGSAKSSGSATVASGAGGATLVYADCSGPPQTRTPQRDPTAIIVTCADDGWSFENLTWTSWTATSATAVGTMRVNLCTPDCAAGKIASYPADVTLSRVADTAAGRVFTQATASFPDGGGPVRYPTGQVITRFTLWYPGG